MKHVRPIYDAASNLICFLNLNSTSNFQLPQENQKDPFALTATSSSLSSSSYSSYLSSSHSSSPLSPSLPSPNTKGSNFSQTLQSSTLIDFSEHLSFLFEIKYNNLCVVALVHYIDLLGEKEGEKIFYDVSKAYYCIKTLKNEFFELVYWKIVPSIWFDKMMILDGDHGTVKFRFY